MTEMVGYEEAPMEYGEMFKDFIKNFRDEHGRFKYMDRLRRMINFDLQSLSIDFSDLYRYNTELAEALIDNPSEVLREASEAIKELVKLEDPEYAKRKKNFIARIYGLFETIKIRDIKSDYVGKLVQVEGIVTRMHPIRSRMVKAWFRHEKCGGEFEWPPKDEIIGDRVEKPSICPVCGEGGGKFVLLKEKSKYIDWQKITLQEKPEDVPGGQMPRSIEVHLTHDLVDSARPGDRITIVGIPRLEQTSTVSPLYEIYLEANSMRVSEKALEEITITREDEEKIKELARDPWIREKIIASISPSIYGHWDLKEAIALSLFGGVPKVMPDGTRVRGDIHVLFVGDPGVAKSQLLQSAARIAPRAVYTSGKGSTAAGLTAAVVRDNKTGEFYLEAGALVLADGGVAIIDEIDKMRSEDRVAIHEAMEQQVISISKAGIVARLNARASILAAGNPKFGIYLENKTFTENVNLPPTIISRFDLIFVVKDKPSLEKDRRLARYILEAHSNVEKFKMEIEPTLLKKYIIYARRYIKPRLSPNAKKLIEEFFVFMRNMAVVGEKETPPIPITARQLEAIIRIAEAHAKMALKDEVTMEDAAEAIRLTMSFLSSVGMTETGEIDAGIIMTGKSRSQIRLYTIILDTIKRLGSDKECVEQDTIVKEVTQATSINEDKVKETLARLYREGYVYKPKSNCFQVVE
ncbi:MAG: minichromosome maintenance protein MCM [Desulfurococcales archaeon]|nr:minichromosome maintenance protein MCM [Desulfurococcales archaeon]